MKAQATAAFLLAAGLLSCRQEELFEPGPSPICFTAEAFQVQARTKADEVSLAQLNAGGFRVSAVTGSPGSESAAWTNAAFTKSGGVWTGNKVWPASNPSYRFYASNLNLSYTSAGATVNAANNTDVVCAYLSNPSYKTSNALAFEHIFARLGNVSVTAGDGFTLSGISIWITPKTGGTYNLRTGAGKTDGTGWSSLSTGSPVNIANATPGTKSNDLYLVPGTYTLTASWTAEKEGYVTQEVSNKTKDIQIMAGSRNDISLTMTADEVLLVSTFGGFEVAPGNLYYDGTTFQIADHWNHESYQAIRNMNAGSYYFHFVELGKFFSSKGSAYAATDGDIDNLGKRVSFGLHDDWRLPTIEEFKTVVGYTSSYPRNGSTVDNPNGGVTEHACYAFLQLTGVTHAKSSSPIGLLLFPDDRTITGKSRSFVANEVAESSLGSWNSNVTEAQLNEFLDAGCVFIPASGYYAEDYYMICVLGGMWGQYWSASVLSQNCFYFCFYDEHVISHLTYKDDCCTVRLIRDPD